MGFIKDTLKLFRLGSAAYHQKIRDLEKEMAVVIEQKDIDDATNELRELRLRAGTFDGYIVGLEAQVDEGTDEVAELKAELAEYVQLIATAKKATEPDESKILEYRGAAKQTMEELKQTEEELAEANTELDTAREEYEELLETIRKISNFLEKAQADHDKAVRQLDMAKAHRAAAQMSSKLGGADGDSAISRLTKSAEARKQKVNEEIGQVRTIRKLNDDPRKKLRERVKAQVANDKHDVALDQMIAEATA